MPEKVVATNENIKELVEKAIKKYGLNADLNFIDVSHVTDMSSLFADSLFNGDISNWNVSNVTNMSGMFEGSPLEANPPKWYKKH
ncbi:MAG: BspA family leucine-rich repeat surface protein [Fibrobacter sp.]|nr:BspA family leucine-rich repeat surface protein [Fibrobacter sp.]